MNCYRMNVQPDGRTIMVKEDESILDAAIRNGIKIKVGCKGGACGVCKIQVLEGDVDRGICSRSVLSLEEIEQGYALACQARAKNNITIHYSVPQRLLDLSNQR